MSKVKRGVCKHSGCKNPCRIGKSDCNTCKTRKGRLANKVRYAYEMVKRSAAKRLIPFNLSYDEFVEFDKKTGYVDRMGRSPDDLTIDRIDSARGYEVGNIRALTYTQNVSKKLEGLELPCDPIAKLIHSYSGSTTNWRAFREQAREVLELVEILQGHQQPPTPEPENDDCPF